MNIDLTDECSVGGSQGPFWSQASQSHIWKISGVDRSVPVLKSVTQLICCVYPLQKHLRPPGTPTLTRKQKAVHSLIHSFIHACIDSYENSGGMSGTALDIQKNKASILSGYTVLPAGHTFLEKITIEKKKKRKNQC